MVNWQSMRLCWTQGNFVAGVSVDGNDLMATASVEDPAVTMTAEFTGDQAGSCQTSSTTTARSLDEQHHQLHHQHDRMREHL